MTIFYYDIRNATHIDTPPNAGLYPDIPSARLTRSVGGQCRRARRAAQCRPYNS